MLLASPRGFCAGVEMAIKALAWMVRTFEPPVYCYHEIVHNKLVVDRFKALGVVFVDEIAEVPDGAPIMLSAHGSAPAVVEAARAKGSYVVDSVCPLVTKVHHEVKVRTGKGYRIVYVGHDGHEEAVGTMAVAPEAIHRVESVEEVDALPELDGPVALLAQTTLSHRDWADVMDATRQRFPDLWTPGRSDLCFATTNRQSALMAMAPRCAAIVVIGSANSSNTRALEKLAVEAGCPRVYRVNHVDELPEDLVGTVGVTAGASAPEELVDAVIARLAPRTGVEEINVTDEDEYFPPPRNIRELQAAIELAATTMTGGSLAGRAAHGRPGAGRQRRAGRAADLTVRRRCGPSGGASRRRRAPGAAPAAPRPAAPAAPPPVLRSPVRAERTSSSSAVHPASHASTVMRSSRDWRRRAPGVSRCASHCSMTGMPPTS